VNVFHIFLLFFLNWFFIGRINTRKRSLFLLFYFVKQSYSLISVCNLSLRLNTAIHFKVHRSLSLSCFFHFHLRFSIPVARNTEHCFFFGSLNFTVKFIKGFLIAMDLHFFIWSMYTSLSPQWGLSQLSNALIAGE